MKPRNQMARLNQVVSSMIKSCQAGTESYSLVTVIVMCSSYLPGETAVTYETIKASGQRVVGQQSCYSTQDVV